ncbi:YceI family protein [Salmonirosea aquatica]
MHNNTLIGAAMAALLLTGGFYAAPDQAESQAQFTLAPGVTKATTFAVDASQSSIRWKSKKVGGEHIGIVKMANGQLNVDGSKLTGGTFVADMKSLRDVDKGESNPFNERLVNHLRSEDFFSVEKFPTSTFKITSAKPIKGAKAGEPNYTIGGDLTIKGTTKPQTFPSVVTISGDAVQATANFMVNRLDYDIKYRAAIIGTAADKIIEDTFLLDLKIVANKASI